jgi:hypothetical protein
VNLKQDIEHRLAELGLTPPELLRYSDMISDLINGKGVLVVRRADLAGVLVADDLLFYEGRNIKDLVPLPAADA